MSEITIKTLVDKYFKAKKLKRLNCVDDDASPLLPLIIMNIVLQQWDHHIKMVECHREMKKWKTAWWDNYHAFAYDYYQCYDVDEMAFLGDMMKTLEEYIADDLVIVVVQVRNLFMEETFERKQVLAACMVANILCQCAEVVWERTFKLTTEKKNANIIACEKYLHKWSDGYYGKGKPDVNPNKSKPLCDAVDILCRKLIKFLNIYRNEKA